MKNVKAFAVAAAAIFVAGGAHAATNILVNGSFENGANGLSNWTLGGSIAGDPGFPATAIFYGNSGAYPNGAFGQAVPVDNAVSNSPDAAGKRGVYFVSDKSKPETLTQSIFLAAGRYEFGFSAYAPQNGLNNPGPATFVASLNGALLPNPVLNIGSMTPTTWTPFSRQVVITTAGSYDFKFEFNTNQKPSKDIVVDRAYVMAVPEPQTWMMMILGFGMVAGALRRRHAAAIAAHA